VRNSVIKKVHELTNDQMFMIEETRNDLIQAVHENGMLIQGMCVTHATGCALFINMFSL